MVPRAASRSTTRCSTSTNKAGAGDLEVTTRDNCTVRNQRLNINTGSPARRPGGPVLLRFAHSESFSAKNCPLFAAKRLTAKFHIPTMRQPILFADATVCRYRSRNPQKHFGATKPSEVIQNWPFPARKGRYILPGRRTAACSWISNRLHIYSIRFEGVRMGSVVLIRRLSDVRCESDGATCVYKPRPARASHPREGGL